MGKVPVRMKAVVYALSPFQQQVMPGLWKDITTKIHHKVSENWISATLLITPVVGTYQYVLPSLPPIPRTITGAPARRSRGCGVRLWLRLPARSGLGLDRLSDFVRTVALI
jgi:hypothetical protein